MFLQLVVIFACVGIIVANVLPDVRPPLAERTFTSVAINSLIEKLTPNFADENLAKLFSNCLPNTLDTTVYFYGTSKDGDTDSFIITGDIEALWLRDSANQVIPYLPYASQDSELSNLITGLINRHAKSINIDSYANSFNYNASGAGHQSDKRTPPMTRSVFEGKYEIDSLNAFLKLSYWHWHYSGKEVLESFQTSFWLQAVGNVLKTISDMQIDDGTLSNPHYLFQRVTSESLDTLMMGGRGPPGTVSGLSRSLFRPSDDAVTLPYNIPGNAMAIVELNHLLEILGALPSTDDVLSLTAKAKSVLDGLNAGINREMKHAAAMGGVLPYEVDGGSGRYFMDDANVPSLLSLPVLGFITPNHTLYQKTREFVLSDANTFFFSGSDGSGIGGPHVGLNYAWPMAVTMRAMTSSSDEEIASCLALLVKSSAGTGLLHESFNVNNVNDFTRSWFAWANGLFGELILQLIYSKPALVLKGDAATIAAAQALVIPSVSLLAQQHPVIGV